MNRFLFILLILFFLKPIFAQENILNNPQILEKVELCLYNTYACNFEEAKKVQTELELILPQHPSPYFLKGLIIYWEYFPLLPDDLEVDSFETAMKTAVQLSKAMIDKDPNNMEGIFFDIHARAFRAMFWADNGKPHKVLKDLDNMYRMTMKGIEYKEEFSEFYFSSGLYNYYIEAYVEKHPAYKALASLFRKGNKELGLEELKIAIETSTYIKYEAVLFMSLIQLNFEQNMEEALNHISKLYNHFPKNPYYFGQYLVILIHDQHFEFADILCSRLEKSKDVYMLVIYNMTKGFISENYHSRDNEAKTHYLECLKNAENLGPIANLYAAIAEAGLARIAEKSGHIKSARKHRKNSQNYSNYDFILEYRP